MGHRGPLLFLLAPLSRVMRGSFFVETLAAPAHRPTPHRPQRRPRLPHIVEGDPDADLKLKRRVGIFMRGGGGGGGTDEHHFSNFKFYSATPSSSFCFVLQFRQIC